MKKITREDVFEIFTNDMDLDVNIEEIETDKELHLQGIDSLDMMNIFLNLEEKFSIEISEEVLQNKRWATIDEIVENVNALLSA